MESIMHEVEIEWEIHVEFDLYGDCHPFMVQQNQWIPQQVRDWMVSDLMSYFQLNDDERWPMIEYTTMRTVTYEVEVRYTEVAGVKTAKSATCQTSHTQSGASVPNYVKGWVESQAMTEFNQNTLPERRATV